MLDYRNWGWNKRCNEQGISLLSFWKLSQSQRFLSFFQATYVSRFGLGRLASPHFMQLWAHIFKYFSSSLEPMASAAFLQSSLGSLQPSSLQRLDTKLQTSLTSLGSSTARFVRTNKHSSLAITHVLTYLMRERTSLRNFLRLISKIVSPRLGGVGAE